MSKARLVFDSIKDHLITQMNLGDNIVRYQKAVLVCRRCHVPVEATDLELGSYKCPKCDRFRNIKQRYYMPIRDFIEFRKVGLNESEMDK